MHSICWGRDASRAAGMVHTVMGQGRLPEVMLVLALQRSMSHAFHTGSWCLPGRCLWSMKVLLCGSFIRLAQTLGWPFFSAHQLARSLAAGMVDVQGPVSGADFLLGFWNRQLSGEALTNEFIRDFFSLLSMCVCVW